MSGTDGVLSLKRSMSTSVKPFLAILIVFVAASAALAQPAVQSQIDVQYGEANGQRLLLDVYKTESERIRPAILLIHGGGWSGGNKASMKALAESFAAQGFVSIAVGYRLVKPDRDKYPTQLDDVQRAVRWIRKNAATLGVKPELIGAIGFSAGGHLAALLGTRDTRDNSDTDLASFSSRVQAVVNVFGPADFDPDLKASIGSVGLALLTNFLGKTPEEAPELYREASPARHVSKGDAPFLMFHGTADALVPIDQSRRLEKVLKEAGVEVTLVEFEGEGHGFRKAENNQRMLKESIRFFFKHLEK